MFEFNVWYRLAQIVHREGDVEKDYVLSNILMKFCPNKLNLIWKIYPYHIRFLSNRKEQTIFTEEEYFERYPFMKKEAWKLETGKAKWTNGNRYYMHISISKNKK